ncbi:hypothetical protein LX81_00220 [Palleronia aestuarii]|uniref:Uncharacterized protein n=1 Tax=Palleronia aestuarii TaxID=568105 RepID=A0A2W7QD32_9RHOB|nr:hypothetical protein [Palleronia aestuarii]PZX19759.1 hypothetical protein LX81_00220 [Palleronia aestuarii]
MTRALLAALILAGCSPAVTETTRSGLPEGFVGTPLEWDHASGAGGSVIHFADGTMTYDLRGETRTARWSYSEDGMYCMNAGEPDADCFTLIAVPGGFASDDGIFEYRPSTDTAIY